MYKRLYIHIEDFVIPDFKPKIAEFYGVYYTLHIASKNLPCIGPPCSTSLYPHFVFVLTLYASIYTHFVFNNA